MKNYQCFNHKIAVITGAGSGIGRALAQQLSASGAKLALVDVNQTGLDETVATLSSADHVTTYVLDVSDRDAYQDFVKQVITDHGQVDIVINNAGIIRLHSVEEGSYFDYEKTMDINFWGVLYGCKEFLPYLKQSPEAWLVNVCSADGLIGFANYSSYCSSKFAVRGLTDSLRAALRNTNVNVCCVFPGGINTNIANTAVISKEAEESGRRMVRAIQEMSPDDAARQIIKGMAKKKKRLLVGTDAKLLDILVRLFPVGMDGFYARYT